MFRSASAAALVLSAVAVTGLAGCESTPEPLAGVAAQAVGPEDDDALLGIPWRPVDLIGCTVPWGVPVMVEAAGIEFREFTFTDQGVIRVRQAEAPKDPDGDETYTIAYSRDGLALNVRAGLGVETWTIRELTTVRLLLEDENGHGCWLRRAG